MHHASCCMLHGASGAQGEWLDLACGGNLTDFPRGFSSTVCRTCRTLTSMVLPHLPVIVQLHRQVSSTRPSPHLRRARTLARGLRRAPSPHLPREPSPYRPQRDPAPTPPKGQPRDRAPSPYPRISAPTTSPQTRPPAWDRALSPPPSCASDRGPNLLDSIETTGPVFSLFSAPRQDDMGKEKAAVRRASLRSLSFSCDGVRGSSQWMGPLGGAASPSLAEHTLVRRCAKARV